MFSDSLARKKLEAITHPRIAQRMVERTTELARAGEPLACYEAALIVENGLVAHFRPLVVCACSEEVQLARIRSRDRALRRGRARPGAIPQMPLAEKVAVADFVIDTSGPVENNARQSDEVLAALCTRQGVDARRYE